MTESIKDGGSFNEDGKVIVPEGWKWLPTVECLNQIDESIKASLEQTDSEPPQVYLDDDGFIFPDAEATTADSMVIRFNAQG